MSVCVSVFAFVCAWCGVVCVWVCVDFVHQQTKMARKLWTANVRASLATPVGVALVSPVANTVAAALRAGNAFRNGRTSIFNGHMYRGGHVKSDFIYLYRPKIHKQIINAHFAVCFDSANDGKIMPKDEDYAIDKSII